MKAVAFTHSLPIESPESLIDVELPDPSPRHHDVMVEVRAVSVNPVDTKQRLRGEPLGEPRVLGYDAAGIVRSVGSEGRRLAIGDGAYYARAMDRPGSNAQYKLGDERIIARKPHNLSFAEAAALPLTTLTAWEMLFDRFRLPRDRAFHDTLLIVGGAGGVGGKGIVPEDCAGCRGLQGGVGSVSPERRGLFGRRAGSLPGYPYSAAMRDSGIVWSAKTLDRFIADPRRVVPGTSMAFPGIPDPQIRARLIAYLATATR